MLPPTTPRGNPALLSGGASPSLMDTTMSPGLLDDPDLLSMDEGLDDLSLTDQTPRKARASVPGAAAPSSARAKGKMRFLEGLEESSSAMESAGAAAATSGRHRGLGGMAAGNRGGRPRFSLFAKPVYTRGSDHDGDQSHDADETGAGHMADDVGTHDDAHDDTFLRDALLGSGSGASSGAQAAAEETERNEAHGTGQETPEQTQRQLQELRRMNEVFEGYEAMLRSSAGQIDVFAQRIEDTNALLDVYIDLLRQTDRTQRLLLDGEWKGATEDASAHALALELAERETRRMQAEAEAAAAAAAQAAAEAEERRRLESERLAREAAARGASAASGAARGRGRGAVRGTRGTGVMRGRGTVPVTPASSARSSSTTSSASLTRGTGIARARPTASTRGTGRGTTTGTETGTTRGGLGGKYAGVQSSGYGPPRR